MKWAKCPTVVRRTIDVLTHSLGEVDHESYFRRSGDPYREQTNYVVPMEQVSVQTNRGTGRLEAVVTPTGEANVRWLTDEPTTKALSALDVLLKRAGVTR